MKERGCRTAGIATVLLVCIVAASLCVVLVSLGPSRDKSLPLFDLKFGPLELTAVTTNSPNCPPRLPCPLFVSDPQQEFYAVWLFTMVKERDGVGITGRRLLVQPLTR